MYQCRSTVALCGSAQKKYRETRGRGAHGLGRRERERQGSIWPQSSRFSILTSYLGCKNLILFLPDKLNDIVSRREYEAMVAICGIQSLYNQAASSLHQQVLPPASSDLACQALANEPTHITLPCAPIWAGPCAGLPLFSIYSSLNNSRFQKRSQFNFKNKIQETIIIFIDSKTIHDFKNV